ncbi:MAG: terminase family protein [Pseudomonadota bacterium]
MYKTLQTQMRQKIEPYADLLWEVQRRPDQTPPRDDHWTTWLLLGGRGAGKTRAGAEWINRLADESPLYPPVRLALIAQSYGDAREVMIEGASGVRSVGHSALRPSYEVSRRRLTWPSGAVAYCFSAEDPDGLRGYQFDAAWADEVCKWRYPDETWSNLQLALRLGQRPRQMVTTTPRPMALLRRIMAAKTTIISRASSYDNRANLADAFFSEIASAYEGTKLGRQELLGEIIDDLEGALWTWKLIEAARISAAPELDRIVVAIDPPAGAGPDADECGIIVAGLATVADVKTGFVLADRSVGGLSPAQWGMRVAMAYEDYQADAIVIETNQGGEMARHVLKSIDAALPVQTVFATRGKHVRAEPVAALYEQGRVRHVGAFPKLEDQLTTFTGLSSGRGNSPDRLDALVWALTDLLVNSVPGQPGIRTFD